MATWQPSRESEEARRFGEIALSERISRAGGTVRSDRGRPVVVDYGSVTGEIALCRSRAGLSVRPEMLTATIEGDENRLDEIFRRITADPGPYVGAALLDGRTWWLRQDHRRVFAIALSSDPREWRDSALTPAIHASSCPLSIDWDVILPLSLVGPLAEEIVAPHLEVVPALDRSGLMNLAGYRVAVLPHAGGGYLLLPSWGIVEPVLSVLLEAGRPSGIGLVGSEALQRLTAAA